MCGIVGSFRREGGVLAGLMQGLRTLEYRGYDSVGVGVFQNGGIAVRRRAGRIGELESLLADGALNDATVGIGHSRWATHGPPTDENAHPHSDATGRLVVVHNGIIENYQDLRAELVESGVELHSDTDTEVLAHLISKELESAPNLAQAVRGALTRVQGYYAIAVLRSPISAGQNGAAQLSALDAGVEMACAREGPPICVAVTDDAAYLASDALAILPFTRDVIYLHDGDVATLSPGRLEIFDATGSAVEREVCHIDWNAEASDRGGYEHFMLKEIHEQPDVLARCLYGRTKVDDLEVHLDGEFFDDESLRSIERLQIVACGTALHAGLVGRYQFEGLAGIPVDVDFASEFRYRQVPMVPGTVAIGISQSGETADTLAALRLARDLGCRQLSICNSIGSTMVRESDASILIEAGPEIGVASTKAFVAMLAATYLFALRLGRARGRIDDAAMAIHLEQLRSLRAAVEHLLTRGVVDQVRELAQAYGDKKGFLFLGRGINYPIALEGALKLKEISYMHAEGYPAGEMKHGPIAMIEPDLVTVVVAPADSVADKVRSNIEQVRARGGTVLCIGNDPKSLQLADGGIEVPEVGAWLSPILNVIPLQLFSYYVALARGCDIDKPRNLAKSVTVE